MIVALLPFFLVARLPIEDGAWRYGPEYVFTVHTNLTKTLESTGVSANSYITHRLYCIMKKHDTLSCNVKGDRSYDFESTNDMDEEIRNLKNVTDDPIELIFDEWGIDKIVSNKQVSTCDLNILRAMFEQLNTGDNFADIKNGTYEIAPVQYTIGVCNVIYEISRRPTENTERSHRFKLESLQLHKARGETLVVDKRVNLNDCSSYAENYYRKFGDTIVFKNIGIDLESITSHMEISDTSFISSTTKKSKDNEKYHVMTTTIILEDIRPSARKPPLIAEPNETIIVGNFPRKDISVDQQ